MREESSCERPQADNAQSKFRFFQSSTGASTASGASTSLNKLFDRYRGEQSFALSSPASTIPIVLIQRETHADNPGQEPDSIGVAGSMRYLGDLGVNLDEAVVLAILTELASPTMGELTREGFVEGWKTYQSVPPPGVNLAFPPFHPTNPHRLLPLPLPLPPLA